MAVTLDQANIGENSDDTSSATITITTTNAVASGGVIVVAAMWASGSFFSSTISGGGLTWSGQLVYDFGPGNHSRVMHAAYAPSGLASSTVITCTFDGAVTQKQFCGSSWLGVDATVTPIPTEDTDFGNVDPPADNPTYSSSLTTVTANALLVSWAEASNSATSPHTPSGTSTPTEVHEFGNVPATNTCVLEYYVADAAGAYSIGGQWTSSPAFNGIGWMAMALKASPETTVPADDPPMGFSGRGAGW